MERPRENSSTPADSSSESSARVAIRIDRALKIGHPCAHLAWKVPSSAVSELGRENRSSVCTGGLSILHLGANWLNARGRRLLCTRAILHVAKDAQFVYAVASASALLQKCIADSERNARLWNAPAGRSLVCSLLSNRAAACGL
jgi:hypothetical protein